MNEKVVEWTDILTSSLFSDEGQKSILTDEEWRKGWKTIVGGINGIPTYQQFNTLGYILDKKISALSATVKLCSIKHDFEDYPTATLLLVEYAVGVQGAGEGPAGGTELGEVPLRLVHQDKRNIDVYTSVDIASIGEVEEVVNAEKGKYYIGFKGSTKSLVLTFGKTQGASKAGGGSGTTEGITDEFTERILGKISKLQSDMVTLGEHVGDGKEELAEAITEKGVDTASSDSFHTMAENVRAISGGSGSVTLKLPNTEVSTLPYNFYGGCALYINEEIHIFGNSDSSYAKNHYKLNKTTGIWESVSTLPYNFYSGCALYIDGEIHIFGGRFYETNKKHYKLNKTTGTWESVSTLPYEFSGGCALYINEEIHIFGDSQQHYKLNKTTGIWESVSTLKHEFSSGCALYIDGEIHIIGGSASQTSHYLALGLLCCDKNFDLDIQGEFETFVEGNKKYYFLN